MPGRVRLGRRLRPWPSARQQMWRETKREGEGDWRPATCVAEDFKPLVMRTVEFMHNTKGAQRMRMWMWILLCICACVSVCVCECCMCVWLPHALSYVCSLSRTVCLFWLLLLWLQFDAIRFDLLGTTFKSLKFVVVPHFPLPYLCPSLASLGGSCRTRLAVRSLASR